MKQNKNKAVLENLPLGWIVTGALGTLLLLCVILLFVRCGKTEARSPSGQQVRNGKAVIETFAQAYTVETADGKKLTSDGTALTGDLSVKQLSLEPGAAASGIPGSMVYEVTRSDRFTFKNTAGTVSYAVSTDSYYGSVSGDGIACVSIGEDGLEISGSNLYVSLILDVGIGKCRNFYLDCTGSEKITVRVEGSKVIAEGLTGSYTAALSNEDLQKCEDWTTVVNGSLTVDLSQIKDDVVTRYDGAGENVFEVIWLLEEAVG